MKDTYRFRAGTNEPESVREFLRSGRQDVYSTHESAILSGRDIKTGLGGRSGFFSIYKARESGTILDLSQSQRSKGLPQWLSR